MRLTILGTRGGIKPSAPRHRNHSGVLIDGKLLFDLGERIFLRRTVQAVFITHLHPDHAFFIRKPAKITLPVYAPEQKGFSFVATVAAPISIGLYTVTPVPTEHSTTVTSCAYLIEKGSVRVLYTGDILWMKKKFRSRLGRLDCIITEASFIKEGGMIRKNTKSGMPFGHAGIPNLVRLFKPYTNQIVLTHFGSWFFKDIPKARETLLRLGQRYGVKIVAAYDGMKLVL